MSENPFFATLAFTPEALKVAASFCTSLATGNGSVVFHGDGRKVCLSLRRESNAPKVVGGRITEYLDIVGAVETYSPGVSEPVELRFHGAEAATVALILRSLAPGLKAGAAKAAAGFARLYLEVWPSTYDRREAAKAGFMPQVGRPSSVAFRYERANYAVESFGPSEPVMGSLRSHRTTYARFHNGNRVEQVDLSASCDTDQKEVA